MSDLRLTTLALLAHGIVCSMRGSADTFGAFCSGAVYGFYDSLTELMFVWHA